MENVPGLANGRGKQIFTQALAELEPSYQVTYDVLNCADYGVPQTRRRLVLHGIRNDIYQLLIQINQILQLACHQKLIQITLKKSWTFTMGNCWANTSK